MIAFVSASFLAPIQPVYTQKPFSVKKENYDRVQRGWTRQQVKQLFGEPKSQDEIDMEGFGKVERWWYWTITKSKAMLIIFDGSGKVTDKAWDKS